MGNLTHFSGSNPAENFGDTPDHAAGDGYASEDFVPGSGSGRARKKGPIFVSLFICVYSGILIYECSINE